MRATPSVWLILILVSPNLVPRCHPCVWANSVPRPADYVCEHWNVSHQADESTIINITQIDGHGNAMSNDAWTFTFLAFLCLFNLISPNHRLMIIKLVWVCSSTFSSAQLLLISRPDWLKVMDMKTDLDDLGHTKGESVCVCVHHWARSIV